MAPNIDSSILRALSLDASSTRMTSHGGSGFSSTFRLTTPKTSIFVKTAPGDSARVMFEGEHASLNAIHGAVPTLCPQAFAWGELEAGNGFFLATEFLELGGGSRRRSGSEKGKGSGMSLARKLAKLHSTPAPVPEGYNEPKFGFPVTTCCGDTPQPNPYTSSWADFYAQNRLHAVLERGEKNNGPDSELRKVVRRTMEEVVPKLLGKGYLGGEDGITPVVVHGDLWSGNHGQGSFVGRGDHDSDDQGPVEEVVFDPSCVWGHSELELGIMRMFGGFGASFMNEYHSLVPKTKPVEEYEDRVCLYESYHHLNHWAMFGGGYRSGAMRLLKDLLRKYGDKV